MDYFLVIMAGLAILVVIVYIVAMVKAYRRTAKEKTKP
jgi:heme/copper-type cytochrome/quinol oxidase subunit 2